MEKSTTLGKLAAALVTFQSNMGKVKKDAKNPFFKSNYASLPNIIEAIQKPLSEAGLAISQMPDGEEHLITILLHAESGEFMQSSYNIHAAKKDPQGIGSAITYARRYALGAVLGLSIDDDDDGNAATTAKRTETEQAVAAAMLKIKDITALDALTEHFNKQPKAVQDDINFLNACGDKKKELLKPKKSEPIPA